MYVNEVSFSPHFHLAIFWGKRYTMATIDLTQYGITGTTEIVHNPDYNQLFREELRPDLEG